MGKHNYYYLSLYLVSLAVVLILLWQLIQAFCRDTQLIVIVVVHCNSSILGLFSYRVTKKHWLYTRPPGVQSNNEHWLYTRPPEVQSNNEHWLYIRPPEVQSNSEHWLYTRPPLLSRNNEHWL